MGQRIVLYCVHHLQQWFWDNHVNIPFLKLRANHNPLSLGMDYQIGDINHSAGCPICFSSSGVQEFVMKINLVDRFSCSRISNDKNIVGLFELLNF